MPLIARSDHMLLIPPSAKWSCGPVVEAMMPVDEAMKAKGAPRIQSAVVVALVSWPKFAVGVNG